MRYIQETVERTRELREMLLRDRHRPHFHLVPPEGFYNDPNGMIYWNGRYHLFYLARTPAIRQDEPDTLELSEVWDHVSSKDLIHWMIHPPALKPAADGSTPLGIWSGGAVAGAPVPTLVYHVPGQGTCMATSEDYYLENWTLHPKNPLIRISSKEGPQPNFDENDKEYVVFDPTAWYEDGTYHLLLGNKSNKPGYEGDCTSYFTSTNLQDWDYKGPFYKSKREWSSEETDCACPDFFPLGDRHMLLMHSHAPRFHVHYYLGRRGETFEPESYGKISQPTCSFLAAPETLIDDKGRRIMIAWVREAGGWDGWHKRGWGSAMSLPTVLGLDDQSRLTLSPVAELQQLRERSFDIPSKSLDSDQEVSLDGVRGTTLELELTLDPQSSERCGFKVLCSPDGREETTITWDPALGMIRGDFSKSSINEKIDYDRLIVDDLRQQDLPFSLDPGEMLKLKVFVDRSVVDVFVNERLCMTLRVYPELENSDGVKVFSQGGAIRLMQGQAWSLARSNPW